MNKPKQLVVVFLISFDFKCMFTWKSSSSLLLPELFDFKLSVMWTYRDSPVEVNLFVHKGLFCIYTPARHMTSVKVPSLTLTVNNSFFNIYIGAVKLDELR